MEPKQQREQRHATPIHRLGLRLPKASISNALAQAKHALGSCFSLNGLEGAGEKATSVSAAVQLVVAQLLIKNENATKRKRSKMDLL